MGFVNFRATLMVITSLEPPETVFYLDPKRESFAQVLDRVIRVSQTRTEDGGRMWTHCARNEDGELQVRHREYHPPFARRQPVPRSVHVGQFQSVLTAIQRAKGGDSAVQPKPRFLLIAMCAVVQC